LLNRSFEENEIKKTLSWLSKHWDRPIHPEYHSASTVDEAISMLNSCEGKAKLFSGGIDVISLMKNRVLLPDVLVNIKPIKRLKTIVVNSRGIAIGTLALINDLERSGLIKDKYPILFETAHSIASPHIRNMATIGGNLCQDSRCWYYRRSPDTGISFDCKRKRGEGKCYARGGENQYHAIMGESGCVSVCPSDMATTLLAMDARIKTVSSSGRRLIPIDELYTPFGNILKHDEIITRLEIPEIPFGSKQKFIKFRLRKTIDFAIVSVAAVIKLEGKVVSDARIVLGGVASKPYRAVKAEECLLGETITERSAAEAAERAVVEARPLSKNGYKVQIVKALVRRAVMT